MASIGQFSFNQWRIRMPVIVRPKVRLPPRAGVPGHIIARGEQRSELAMGWTAVICQNTTIARALLLQYAALAAGTQSVVVVDQFGIRFNGCTVMSVAGDGTAYEISQQINGTARLDVHWTLDVGFT